MKKLIYNLNLKISFLTVALLAALIVSCSENPERPNMTDSQKQNQEQTGPGQNTQSQKTAKATFAAGCFWGVEHAFRQIEGVVSTTVGYAGGHLENPTYEQVCSGRTGHAEVVLIEYNPDLVSYQELLDIFWTCHDPTAPDRQDAGVGYQYRSAVFYHAPQQKTAAENSKEKLRQSGKYDQKIMTEITPAPAFFPAEEYHQQYLAKKGKTSCSSTLK
jgi:peptide-methionine (S)-S-oxide reductase